MSERKIKITNQYVKAGLTIFIVGVALIAAYHTLTHPKMVLGAIGKINDILFPFYLGGVMAYLMCPVYNSTTRAVYKITKGKLAHPIRDLKIARAVASFASVVVIVAVVAGLIWMVLPDLWESIMGLISNLPDTVTKVSGWIETNLAENPQLAALLGDKLDSAYATALSWAQGHLLPNMEAILSNLSVGVIGTLGVILDVFVALIICVYVLNSKEIFVAQTKKMILALFKPERKIVTAVDDVSFSIEQGEIVGYIGPNGAGKSTTVKMMSGILRPTSGEILINGISPVKDRKAVRFMATVVFVATYLPLMAGFAPFLFEICIFFSSQFLCYSKCLIKKTSL